MLFLSERDLRQVGGDDPAFYLPVVREVFALHHQGAYLAPPRLYLRWAEGMNQLNLMPALIGGRFGAIGVKVVAGVPANRERGRKPRANALLVLYSPEDGFPLALLAGTRMTAHRTAAVSALAALHLAAPGRGTLGILGAGPVAAAHVLALRHAGAGVADVAVFNPTRERAERFCGYVARETGLSVRVANTAEEAVRGRGLVLTATSAREPCLEGSWLADGALVLNVGITEPHDSVFSRAARVIVDDLAQCTQPASPLARALRAGLLAPDDVLELGAVLHGGAAGRLHADEVLVVNPGGLGIVDAACGAELYRRARQAGLGSTLELHLDDYGEFGERVA